MAAFSHAEPQRARSVRSLRALANGDKIFERPVSKDAVRAALYLRVSGKRSVESNLSIPEQEAQLRRFCENSGWKVAAVYVEPGKSAKTISRPQFRRMVEDAQALKCPFNKVVIWTTSRFSRRTDDYAIFERQLRNYGIDVVSVSQSFAPDAGGLVAKRVTTAFDEYHSYRSAEDSVNARRRLAQEGYWPGGKPADGLKLIPAPDNARRKIVVVDEERRPLIVKVFNFALHGDGKSAPMGIKKIAEWLNSRGFRTRNGSRWSLNDIQRMLANPAYCGEYFWGVNPAERDYHARQEPVLIRIPAILNKSMYEDVQRMLEKRDPKMGKSKVFSSPLLLSSLAQCAECGAGMTLRTGRGNGGDYRYYYCGSTHKGKLACGGPSIPEKELDEAVLWAVRSKVLDQEHLIQLLQGLHRREKVRANSAFRELPLLQAAVAAGEASLNGLWIMIGKQPEMENDPFFQHNLQRSSDDLIMARKRLEDAMNAVSGTLEVTEEAIAQFRSRMIELLEGNTPARKNYLSTIVERIEVGASEILIVGYIDDLRRAVENSNESSSGDVLPAVHRYERRWRRGWDSNPRRAFTLAGFQDRCLKPLGHPSSDGGNSRAFASGEALIACCAVFLAKIRLKRPILQRGRARVL